MKTGEESLRLVVGQTRLVFLLSHLSGLPIERQLPIVPVNKRGRRMEGIVEPAEQFPVDKQLLAQQRAQIG